MLIPKSVLGLVECCDESSARYALGGIRFERDTDGSACAVATNGRVMAAFSWREDDDHPLETACVPGFGAVVPVKACRQAKAFKIARGPKAVLQNIVLDEPSANGTVKLSATDLDNKHQIEPKALEGRFPKWRDIVPKHRGVSVHLDPKLLAELLSTLAGFVQDDEHRGVTITLAEDEPHNKPVVVSADRQDGRKAVGVIMPLSIDRDCKILPKPVWLAAMPEVPAPEEPQEPLPPVEYQCWGLASDCEELLCASPQTVNGPFTQEHAQEYADRWWKDTERIAGESPDCPRAEHFRKGQRIAVLRVHPCGEPGKTEDFFISWGHPAAKPRDTVTCKALRENPDELAPVSGKRCRSCGANAAMRPDGQIWRIVCKAAYCPKCDEEADAAGIPPENWA